MFKHGICDEWLGISDGMPDSSYPLSLEFFANLGCPLSLTAVETKVVEVHLAEMVKDSVEGVATEEQG